MGFIRNFRRAAALSVLLLYPVSLYADFSAGKAVYQRYCQACHQPSGAGIKGVFPPLANNTNLINKPEHIAKSIIRGVSGSITVNGDVYNGVMPPMAYLSDSDIALVVDFILNEWNGSQSGIRESEVKSLR